MESDGKKTYSTHSLLTTVTWFRECVNVLLLKRRGRIVFCRTVSNGAIRVCPEFGKRVLGARDFLAAASSLLLLLRLYCPARRGRPGSVPRSVLFVLAPDVWQINNIVFECSVQRYNARDRADLRENRACWFITWHRNTYTITRYTVHDHTQVYVFSINPISLFFPIVFSHVTYFTLIILSRPLDRLSNRTCVFTRVLQKKKKYGKPCGIQYDGVRLIPIKWLFFFFFSYPGKVLNVARFFSDFFREEKRTAQLTLYCLDYFGAYCNRTKVTFYDTLLSILLIFPETFCRQQKNSRDRSHNRNT